ncbi:MAG: hypothetical protein QW784_06280 [Acidilobaceae archaeon]
MSRRTIRKRYISVYEAKEILENRIRGQARLGEVQERTWSYLSIFGDKEADKARVAYDNLRRLGLSEEVAVNLLNICPESEGEVRSILALQKDLAYDSELIEGILAILKSFCGWE